MKLQDLQEAKYANTKPIRQQIIDKVYDMVENHKPSDFVKVPSHLRNKWFEVNNRGHVEFIWKWFIIDIALNQLFKFPLTGQFNLKLGRDNVKQIEQRISQEEKDEWFALEQLEDFIANSSKMKKIKQTFKTQGGGLRANYIQQVKTFNREIKKLEQQRDEIIQKMKEL